MITEWDYTNLAEAYLKRPDYSKDAISSMASKMQLQKSQFACDVGAGVAHLTIPLLQMGLKVNAVEPNDAMRKIGSERTKGINDVSWFEGTGENTNQPDTTFDLVTFGSSFNVVNRERALLEVKRILKPMGWLAVMWNHRDLNDPVQSEIENIIKSNIS